MPNLLSPEATWSFPSDTPRYVWVGCRNKHAREVYPGQVQLLTHCDICGRPMRELSPEAVERYKRFNRLCWHCRLDNHTKCTGVDCFGCDPANHQRVPIDTVTWTESDASRS